MRISEFLRTRSAPGYAWLIAATLYFCAIASLFALARWLPSGPEFAPFFAAAALAAFFAGPIPAVVLTAAMAATIWYYHIGPAHSWALSHADALALMVIVSGAVLLISLVAWLRWSLDRLRGYESRLSVAIEAASLVAWEDRLRDNSVVWGAGLSRLIGLDEAETPTRELFMSRVHPDDRQELIKKRETAQLGDPQGLDSEFRVILPDGTQRWLTCHGTFVDSGRTRAAGVLGDITIRKTYEDQLKQINSELNHRMKNLFGICIAVFRQTLRAGGSADEIGDVFTGRIMALSAAQDLLGGAGAARPVLAELINALASGLAPHPSRVRLQGPVVSLPTDAATPFALVLHELAMNALKHGAWSNEQGQVRVSWSVATNGHGQPQLAFQWQERGGPAVRSSATAGQGSALISSALPFARVHHELTPDGAQCSIILALSPAQSRNNAVAGDCR